MGREWIIIKKIVWLLPLLIYSPIYAQSRLSDTDKLASLCQVWGFLKYYHPKVVRGKFDWDKELINHLPGVLKAENRNELDAYYLGWIESLGRVKKRTNKLLNTENLIFDNFDTSWINNSSLFSPELSEKLRYIYTNRERLKPYYGITKFPKVRFAHENKYAGLGFPSMPYRLLTLFRFWNIINYYYPSKYLVGENWDMVLQEMIPLFERAGDQTAYYLSILRLAAQINDSHTVFFKPDILRYFGTKLYPFRVKVYDDKLVVEAILNDSLASLDDIRIGDVITRINDVPIKNILRLNWDYIPASNHGTKLRNAEWLFQFGKNDSDKVETARNGIIETKYFHRYNYYHPKNITRANIYPQGTFRLLNDSIGYINLGKLTKKDVKKAFTLFSHTKGIILDLRNYPYEPVIDRVSVMIHPESVSFIKYAEPLKGNPGVFRLTNSFPFSGRTGRKNKNSYKGKVVVLCNETTQSQAEIACLILKSAPNTTFIGNQTAGVPGVAANILLPGNLSVGFTIFSTYSTNGKPNQRTGIIPDIRVIPTQEGIAKGRDEVLEKAVKFIEQASLPH